MIAYLKQFFVYMFFYQRIPATIYSAYTRYDDLNRKGDDNIRFFVSWFFLVPLLGTLAHNADFGANCLGLFVASIILRTAPIFGVPVALLFAWYVSPYVLWSLYAVAVYELTWYIVKD